MNEPDEEGKAGSIKAIGIHFDFKPMLEEYGWLKVLWGYDIFMNGVPMMKSIMLANVITWIVLLILIGGGR